MLLFFFTGSATQLGCGDTTQVECFGKELPDGAHPYPGQQLVWIQNFPSPRAVTTPMLKTSVCPTIHKKLYS